MIKGKKVLAVVPARAGSKGIPGKNLTSVAGKPLIAWTIEAAKQSRFIDRLILSSDDPKIIEVSKKMGCEVPFVRPGELASDEASLVDVVIHAMQAEKSFDLVLLLQPTSPLRTTGDIDGALERMMSTGASSVVSVTEVSKSPYWMYELRKDHRLEPFISQGKPADRRQLLPKLHVLNGAIYLIRGETLLKERSFVNADTVAWEMDSASSIDIDVELDLKLASYLLSERQML